MKQSLIAALLAAVGVTAIAGGVASAIPSSNRVARPTSLWAAVDQHGHLLRGRGVVAATGSTVFPGVYTVRFGRDVSRCALSATIGSYGVSGMGEITAYTYSGSAGKVGVVTRTAASTGTGTTAEPFFLAVVC